MEMPFSNLTSGTLRLDRTWPMRYAERELRMFMRIGT